jgi:integrase
VPIPEREADEALARLIARAARLRDGGTVSPRKQKAGVLTVREAFEAWRAHAKPNLEPNGADTDEDVLRSYVYPHLGDVQLWRLRPDQLAAPGDPDHDQDLVSLTAFYAMLAERGTAGRRYRDGTVRGAGRPLGSQTIRRVHGTMSRAFDYCVDRNWIRSNPAVGAKLPPVVKRVATTPSAGGLAAFIRWLEHDAPEVLCFLDLMNSGARRVDMGLQWLEVSFGAEGGGAVTFGARGLITSRGPDGKPVVLVRTTPTRKRRLRTVALDPVAAGRLLALRTAQEVRAALGDVELRQDAFVFPAPTAIDGGQPRDPNWFSGAFRYAKKRAAKAGLEGLEKVRPYDVRHFMISQLLAHGESPAVVAERAGNSQRTMDAFYRHAVPARDQAAAELMARILRDAGSANG